MQILKKNILLKPFRFFHIFKTKLDEVELLKSRVKGSTQNSKSTKFPQPQKLCLLSFQNSHC